MVPPGLCWEVGLRQPRRWTCWPFPPGPARPRSGKPPPPPHCCKAPGAAWSGERPRPPAPLCPSPSLPLPWDSRLGGDTGASFVLVICVPRVRPVFRPPGLRQLNTTPNGSWLSRPEAQGGGGVGGRGLGTLGRVSSLPPQRPAGHSRPSVPVASLWPPPPPPRGLRCVVFLLLLLLGTFVSGFGAHLSQPG